MENINEIVNFLNRLTEKEKKEANEIAGGNFEKLLAEFKAIQTTFSEKNCTRGSIDKFGNFRAYDIRDIFFLQQKEGKKTELQIFNKDASLDLKKLYVERKSSSLSDGNPTITSTPMQQFGIRLLILFIFNAYNCVSYLLCIRFKILSLPDCNGI